MKGPHGDIDRDVASSSGSVTERRRSPRSHHGRRVTLAREKASLHLIVNLVSSTIQQLVLDPPPDVSKEEMLDELAERIQAWVGWC